MGDAVLTPQMREILDIVGHAHAPVMVLQAPSLVITAASPGAHEVLDPIAQPIIGRCLNDFIEDHPSGAMPLLAAGRITGYETLRVLKKTGQRRRMWIGALPNTSSRQSVIAVLLKETTVRRVVIPWRCEDASSPVIGSADARLMVDRVSAEVYESLGYRPEEIAGTSLLALIAEKDVAMVLAALAQTTQHRGSATLRVSVIGADLAPVTCQLALLPLIPAPSCAFALRIEGSDGPADGRAIANLITHLGLETRGGMRSRTSTLIRPDMDLSHLCSRELKVVSLLMAGDRVSSMARTLLLSEGTIRNHLSSAFGKLGVGTQQELIELLRPTPAEGDRRTQGDRRVSPDRRAGSGGRHKPLDR